MASSNASIDHDEIRSWAEERDGRPARVKGTGRGDDPGMLRIDFPGFSGEDSLEEIDWDTWFEAFEENGLALIFQDRTADGQESRFNKLVSRETVEQREEEDSHASVHRKESRSSGKTAKRSASKTAGRSASKTAGRSKGKTAGRSASTADGRSAGKTASGRSTSKTAGKSAGRATGKTGGASGRSAAKSAGKTAGRSTSKTSGRNASSPTTKTGAKTAAKTARKTTGRGREQRAQR